MVRRRVAAAGLTATLLAAVAGCAGPAAPVASSTSGAVPSAVASGGAVVTDGGPLGDATPTEIGGGTAWSGLRTCPGDLPAYRCAFLAVPLDRKAAGSERLPLLVVAGGDLHADRTLVFLTGGPGQGGTGAAERIVTRFGGAAAGLRIVLVDQRGTGGLALSCPRLQDEVGTSDLTVPTPDAVRACADTLGPKRAFYATSDTVADLEDLRRALGVERISFDGVSYGTYVAQRYAATHPTRVDRLVLDSVVPVTGFDPLLTAVFPEVTRVLAAVCQEASCGRDPSADLAATVRRWPDLGPALLDTLTAMSVVDPTYGGVLDAVRAGANGDDGPARNLVTTWRQRQAAPADVLSQGLHASTLCLDFPFPWGGADTEPNIRGDAVERAVAALPPDRLAPFGAGTATGNGFVATCRYWPRTPDPFVDVDRSTDLPALARSGPRTLILAGDRDLSTPMTWAQTTAAAMPGSRLVVVPRSGHSVQSRSGGAVGSEVTRFLLAP
jgi:pimeloyl-ACP methyl ester carboxylesterase